jgi:hypothetical protein
VGKEAVKSYLISEPASALCRLAFTVAALNDLYDDWYWELPLRKLVYKRPS